jgi:hypothetical protein
MIPPSVPVSASETLGAYVSTRRQVAIFPAIGRADWVIVGLVAKSDEPVGFDAALRRLKASHDWKTVFAGQDVTVFERVRDHL